MAAEVFTSAVIFYEKPMFCKRYLDKKKICIYTVYIDNNSIYTEKEEGRWKHCCR